ncbi:class I SAM-dependent methyltransferase [Shewanella avicenniae]|uniref:Class I SAM-dependent methyltransferase n=1 Tax=Shewanella avicenniae TaxID=2814294 RepID=A0ABX7QU53_9GAMM|nr:class I SAM-dependent methyltransferase [Shewanella avicenniae]QSX35022.1 class I SAM-dependent methyltransferase [Shewanella avicenniae]
MKLNRFERMVVKHPVRHWLQRTVEQPLLLKLFDNNIPAIDKALEIGCGFGQGIQLLRSGFGAASVVAVDLDEEMLAFSAARYPDSPWLTLMQADATRLPFDDQQFDLVCDFAVFHHVPDWQTAVDEVFRVLKPGGAFVIEELYRAAICNPISKRLFEHPQTNRFNHSEMHQCLKLAGFSIRKAHHLPGLAGLTLAIKPANSVID